VAIRRKVAIRNCIAATSQQQFNYDHPAAGQGAPVGRVRTHRKGFWLRQISYPHLFPAPLHTPLIPIRNKKTRCQWPSRDRAPHAGRERYWQGPVKGFQDRGDKRALLILIALQFRPRGARFANQCAVASQGKKQSDFHSLAACRRLPAGKQCIEHFVDCADRGTAATNAFASVSRARNNKTNQ
jgi:hypothetical protein